MWIFKTAYTVRRARGGGKYALMLIDFAEASQPQLNVFELGKMAKDLQRMLYLTESLGHKWQELEDKKKDATEERKAELTQEQEAMSRDNHSLNLQDPEDLIERFCDKLDFGEMTMRVKKDAVNVTKTMNRDWMTTGRRPAGVAGAAVIIAARMNNFRRTLREVVLVAKVTEITLSKRIEEFKETKSSKMSVEAFRAIDQDTAQVDQETMPPSYYQKLPEWQEKQAAKKRKRGRNGGQLPETAAEIETGEEPPTDTDNDSGDGEEDEEEDTEQPPAKRPRVDADGFAVPELPVRPSRTPQPDQPQKRKVGKPKGAKNWQPPPPTEAELQEEEDLTEDIRDQLRRNASLDPTGSIAQSETARELPAPAPGVVNIMYPAPKSKEGVGPHVHSDVGNTMKGVQMNAEIENDEFDDDPDVANCVLNETERTIKETIWVTENADWLRLEHSKKIKKELKDRELREKGIDPEKERLKKLRRKDGMMRAGRSGDIAYLEEARNKKRARGENDPNVQDDGEGQEDEDDHARRQRISQGARGSVQVMLQQRGTFSRRVDYDKLSQAYVLPGFEDSSESRSESPDTRHEADHFFRPATSKGAANSNVRRARVTLAGTMRKLTSNDTEGETDTDAPSPGARSRSRSAPNDESAAAAAETTPEVSERPTQADTTGQLLTPGPSQAAPLRQVSPMPRPSPVPSIIDESDSPLSSTHTPAGYGSGAHNTPQPMQQLQQQVKHPVPDEPDDNNDDDDDDDEEEEEEENENENEDQEDPGDDPDVYFARGEEFMGEAEEVVEDHEL
ncbi:transcription factor TFIIIB subunit brf1 [Lithohypha guttulata]|uniref:Transcription factor TFIIIB subunit brf1 n=1 Tax=Lithohypha guttulata TaxID=1690604 RepID=A0AAN7SZS3_9EURO|nr:transcription factor TFIIIB subunit brf1 [Lithohypha guttulata]